MSRVVVLAALIAALPPSCGKLLGKKDPASEDTTTTSAPPPPPPPSVTTPPIWQSPGLTPPPSAPTAPAVDPTTIDLTKAQAAFDAKDFKKSRALLEKRVKGGKCVADEVALLVKTCQQLKDAKCVADTKKACPPTPNTSNDEPQKLGF